MVTLVFEIVAGSSARNPKVDDISTHRLIVDKQDSDRSIKAGNPPIDCAHNNESSASSITSKDGVLMVLPLKIAALNFPFDVRRNNFGIGHDWV